MIDSFTGEYDFLSNFYEAPITLPSGDIAETVEHAFQAYKATDPDQRLYVLASVTPGKAKQRGRAVKLRSDWDEVRDEFMLELVRMKFLTHADLAEKLLATGDEELVEGNTWGDKYWGKVFGKGENHLGQILMQVRQELRDAQV